MELAVLGFELGLQIFDLLLIDVYKVHLQNIKRECDYLALEHILGLSEYLHQVMHGLRRVLMLTSVLLSPHDLALLLLIEIELLTNGGLLELQLQLPDSDSCLEI